MLRRPLSLLVVTLSAFGEARRPGETILTINRRGGLRQRDSLARRVDGREAAMCAANAQPMSVRFMRGGGRAGGETTLILQRRGRHPQRDHLRSEGNMLAALELSKPSTPKSDGKWTHVSSELDASAALSREAVLDEGHVSQCQPVTSVLVIKRRGASDQIDEISSPHRARRPQQRLHRVPSGGEWASLYASTCNYMDGP